jgi:choline dehydrogenase
MNILIRGVRFSMRIGRANCVKDVLEPKADSTDPKDFFYLGDADPDRVSIKSHTHIAESCLVDTPN